MQIALEYLGTYQLKNDTSPPLPPTPLPPSISRKIWLKFTLLWSWPGPITRLQGGPQEVPARVGIRGIPFDSVKVDIEKAYHIAEEQLRSTDCGDKFVGTISMYWPLTPECTEPFYSFSTNLANVIHVGAYTGKISGCGCN